MQPPAKSTRPPAPKAAPARPLHQNLLLAIALAAFVVLAVAFYLYRAQWAAWMETPPTPGAQRAAPAATSGPVSQPAPAAGPQVAASAGIAAASASAEPPMASASAVPPLPTVKLTPPDGTAAAPGPVIEVTDPASAPSAAHVSRCEVNGKITYSDSGCAPGATGRAVEVGPDKNTVVRMRPASAPVTINTPPPTINSLPTASVPTPATETVDTTNATRLRACSALDLELQKIEAEVRAPTPTRTPEQLTADRKRVSEEYARLRC